MIRIGVVFAAVIAAARLLSGPVHAQSGGASGTYDEAEAQAIDRMLMCPVCPAQTIDQTEAPLRQTEMPNGISARFFPYDGVVAPSRPEIPPAHPAEIALPAA